MLISGKSHSRVESHRSRVSTETLDFVREHTFYGYDRSWVAGEGTKRRGGGGGRCSRFLEVKKFLSRDQEKRSRLLSLVNIPNLIAVMGSRQLLVVESSNLTAF